MKLKTLTLHGFKSFADKTTIHFQPGLTGIVGPNGSGKSNVIEALRWVLGEQSAKNLRGTKMPDVIFAGSQTRSAHSRAWVQVVFDNSDHFLEKQPEEIVVERTLFRDGSSEYELNGKKVRLKDIWAVFTDTGLGRESFSIISQGRVEAIFQAKPEARRGLIEEVAGVVKYKKEKQAALSQLEATTQELARVADIIAELEKQRTPLQQQASEAQDYLMQKRRYDSLHQNQLVLAIKHLTEQKGELTQTVAHLTDVQTKQQQATKQLSTQLRTLQQKQATLNHSIDQKNATLLTTSERLQELSGKQSVSHEQARFNERQQAELTARKQELTEELAASQAQVKELKHTVAHLNATHADLKKQLAALASDAAPVAALTQKIDHVRQTIIDLLQQSTTAHNQVNFLAKQAEQQAGHTAAVAAKIKDLKTKAAASNAKVTALTDQFTQATAQLSQVVAQLTQTTSELAQVQTTMETQTNQWHQAREIYTQAKAKRDTLTRIASQHQGFYHGVKNVLQANLPGVIGAVADLITVAPKYVTAIETVLGAGLQNVVVADDNAGQAAIDYLTQHRLGRATFLPLTTIRPRHLASHLLATAQNHAGFVGVASELVSTKPELAPVVNHLLATTVVVSDLTQAKLLARAVHHQLRIVTLAGEQITAGGAMIGGKFRNQTTGLLEQKRQVEELSGQVAAMAAKLSEQQTAIEAHRARITRLQEQQATLTSQRSECQRQQSELQRSVQVAKLTADSWKRQLAEVTAENPTAAADLTAQQTQAKTQLETLTAQVDEKKATLAQLQSDLTQAQAKEKDQAHAVAKLQQQLAVTAERKDQATRQLAEAEQQVAQTTKTLHEQAAQLEQLKNQAGVRQTAAASAQTQVKALQHQIADLKQTLSDLQTQRDECSQQVADVAANHDRAKELEHATTTELQTHHERLGQLKAQLTTAAQTLSDDYHTTYEAAAKTVQLTDAAVVEQKLRLVQLALADMKDVNVGAIAEFKRVDERYAYLSQQQEDLQTAKAQLQASMDKMDGEVKRRFEATFTQVQAAFSALFPQIFGGGQAKLTLTDKNDLLHTGIEIIASPPGKKLQRLSLLSGGEKALTAITLLFAILQVKPVPFVILDEAEAALDDANVARYSAYLHRFEQQTQFIVITHRKGTMMSADVLYGVTMLESGVSALVTLPLPKAAD